MMTNNVSANAPAAVSERRLSHWLLEHVPAIRKRYLEEVEQHYTPEERQEDISAYFVLSFVLKPHIVVLLNMGHESELQRIFSLLEVIYTATPPANRKELGPRVAYTPERQWGV